MTESDSEKPEAVDEHEAAAREFLAAGARFWAACNKRGQYGAIQWLTGTGGELLIFTRGEYRTTLLQNIASEHDNRRIRHFAEVPLKQP
jgi:hypothetical protein